MPWIGVLENERVVPEEVSDGTWVTCPDCGDEMHPWGPSVTGTARHFQHKADDNRDCNTVGESDVHSKLKSLAVSRLKNLFGDRCTNYAPNDEVRVDGPVSDEVAYRQADALAEFDERDEQLGKGVIIEVQYRNDGKDTEATTNDYLGQDYSVAWVGPDDFDDNQLRLDESELRERIREHVWPDYVPSGHKWTWKPFAYRGLKQRWERSWEDGELVSGAPATLPQEYNDEKALEIWRSQDWFDVFQDHNPGAGTRYESQEYTQGVRDSLQDGPPDQVRLPPEYCDWMARRLWEGRDWLSLFTIPAADWNGEERDEWQSNVLIERARPDDPAVPAEIAWEDVFPPSPRKVALCRDSNRMDPSWSTEEEEAAVQSPETPEEDEEKGWPVEQLPPAAREHEERYEGWNDKRTDKGFVRRFDTVEGRFVTLHLSDIPETAKKRREWLVENVQGCQTAL